LEYFDFLSVEKKGAKLSFGSGGSNQFEYGAQCVDWAIEPYRLIGTDRFSKKVVATGGTARFGFVAVRCV
jgi:hypothetical protein